MRCRMPYDEMEEETKKYIEPKQQVTTISRGERTGMVIAASVLFYALIAKDLPVAFFSLSFLLFEIRPLTVLLGGKAASMASNFLQGFSIALFFGAILLLL